MKSPELLRQYRYEILAFLSGASVMMLEIVGARLIAPYFGASTYVWTAMIGVILASLAIGYWYGGRLADAYDRVENLGVILGVAAVLVLFLAVSQQQTLEYLASLQLDLRLSALLAALLLFGVPSALIGMVSPQLAKLKITSLATTGRSIGRLEAATTLGSIIGTFLCGYFLLGYVGSYKLTLGLVLVLLLASFLATFRVLIWVRLGIAAVAVLLLLAPAWLRVGVLVDRDSAHGRYRVIRDNLDGRAVNYLLTDSYSVQSAAYIDNPTEPVLQYVQRFYDIAAARQPEGDALLVIGGGTHTFPTAVTAAFPLAKVTAVEIDETLTGIAEQYFGLQTSHGIQIVDTDGRAYVNRSDASYDMIFVDAFASLTPPFHLTTREAVAEMRRLLDDDGLIVANIVATHKAGLLESVAATYAAELPYVAAYQADPTRTRDERKNYILLASVNTHSVRLAGGVFASKRVPLGSGMVLTDDFAPVERLSF